MAGLLSGFGVDWVNHPHTYKVEFTSKVYI